MVVSVRSLGLHGIAGYEVRAECFLSGGLPAFDIVGLPDTAVREARERVPGGRKKLRRQVPGQPYHREPGAGRAEEGRHGLRPSHLCGAAGRLRRTPSAAGGRRLFGGAVPHRRGAGRLRRFAHGAGGPGKQGSERCSFRRKTLPRPRWPGGSPSAECRTSDPWCSI